MTDHIDEPALQAACAEAHRERMLDIERFARDVRDLEVERFAKRSMLAARLYYAHEDGVPVAELARHAGMSEEDAFAIIDHYRAHRQ